MTKIFQLKIGSAQLIGEHSGEGRPLIFLHAGVADRRMWHPQIDELQHNFKTVIYDRRGFGETTSLNEVFSHADDLRQFLEKLALTDIVLIGCSQGGRIALDFALANPHQVSALVLIAPAVSGTPEPTTFPQNIQSRINALDEADEAGNLELVNTIEADLWLDGPTSPSGRVDDTLRKLLLDMNGIALGKPELTLEQEPASAYEKLPTLTIPTLIVWGSLDFPHIKERCHYLVNTIPAATGREISDTAHLLNLEKPEYLNNLLQAFLSSSTDIENPQRS